MDHLSLASPSLLGEFAKLFGKSQTWGYRQIYGGKVKAITEHGRILIPAAEVDAILKTAGVYDGMKPKLGKSKEEIQKLAPRLQNAWQSFLAARRLSPAKTKTLGVAAAAKGEVGCSSLRSAGCLGAAYEKA